jgi:D-glycero-alpha-D-manno-heptose-7-phosphate kinase
MIITKTPLRISFFGGGSDLPAFYESSGPGKCISVSIDKYIYLVGIPTPQPWIKLSYSKIEQVEDVSQLQHDIARELLKHYHITSNFELGSFADIPTKGTGLGSSSTFAVGLSKLLSEYNNLKLSKFDIAEEACRMEIDVLGNKIGKQDQYAAAFGGLNVFEFAKEKVTVKPVNIPYSTMSKLESNLLLYYTGIQRSASDILAKQSSSLISNVDAQVQTSMMVSMVDTAEEMLSQGYVDDFGEMLDDAWKIKKNLSSGITSPEIDEIYDYGLKIGALGGKLLGAGGGGYLLFYVPNNKQEKFRQDMKLKELVFKFSHEGSNIVYRSGP